MVNSRTETNVVYGIHDFRLLKDGWDEEFVMRVGFCDDVIKYMAFYVIESFKIAFLCVLWCLETPWKWKVWKVWITQK